MEILLLFFYLPLAILVGVFASGRGRSGFAWFLLSLILSPLLAGFFLIVAGNKRQNENRTQTIYEDVGNNKKCSFCAELVKKEAVKCKHCGSTLPIEPPTPDIQGIPAPPVATQVDSNPNSPRKWWNAALLSIFMPGLGHIYNGQTKRGLLIWLLMVPVHSASLLLTVRFSFIGFLAIILLYHLAVIANSILVARRNSECYAPNKFNKWYAYIGIYVLAAVLSSVILLYARVNIAQAYKVVSSGMEDTILKGDHVLVDKTVDTKKIIRGNIVIFEHPEDANKSNISRVIGLPGDVIEGKAKKIYINGKLYKPDFEIHKEEEFIPSTFNPRDSFGPITVPENSYFMMGDNRDRSYDSRFFRFITREKIMGMVKLIYWSWDVDKLRPRMQRIGQKFQQVLDMSSHSNSQEHFDKENPQAVKQSCLQFEPAMVELNGTLKEIVFPGPPNYENIMTGDTPEHCLVLNLQEPICVLGDPSSDVNSENVRDVKQVQFALVDYNKPTQNMIGKHITAKGTLYGAHTGHHRTPVLLEVKDIKIVK